MEHNYDDIVMLERYIEHSLNEEEIRKVEQRLSEEPAFKELYQNEKLLVRGIRYGHLRSNLVQLKDLESTLPTVGAAEKPARVIIFRTYWKPIALAASVLLVVSWFFVFSPQGMPGNEKLFVAYFEPFDSPGVGTTRSEMNAPQTWKAKAYEAYDKGDYAMAVGLFEKAIVENDDPIVKLCLGNAYLATGRADRAEIMFNKILTEHEDLVTQAKWYLSLAYLKQNKMERTRAVLWEISKSSTYGEKARKLLEELD